MDEEETEAPNAITPRHFAVLVILREIREVRKRIEDNEADAEPTDYFRSQIRVWLERAVEELERAVRFLRDHEDPIEDD